MFSIECVLWSADAASLKKKEKKEKTRLETEGFLRLSFKHKEKKTSCACLATEVVLRLSFKKEKKEKKRLAPVLQLRLSCACL